jgi:hypothetical protein
LGKAVLTCRTCLVEVLSHGLSCTEASLLKKHYKNFVALALKKEFLQKVYKRFQANFSSAMNLLLFVNRFTKFYHRDFSRFTILCFTVIGGRVLIYAERDFLEKKNIKL